VSDFIDPQYISLGAAGGLLALVIRTLLRQEDGWRTVLEAAKQDAQDARNDAAIARLDASAARAAESECRRRLDDADRRVDLLERRMRELESRTPPNGNTI
jgi:uncharacterized membrane protein YccC